MPEAAVLKLAGLLGQTEIEVKGVIARLVFKVRDALFVTVLQGPLTSTEYTPASEIARFVSVSILVVWPTSTPPSFFQIKVHGPVPETVVMKLALKPAQRVCVVKAEAVIPVLTTNVALFVTDRHAPATSTL